MRDNITFGGSLVERPKFEVFGVKHCDLGAQLRIAPAGSRGLFRADSRHRGYPIRLLLAIEDE